MSVEDYCPICGRKLDPGKVYSSPAHALPNHQCSTRVLGAINAADTRANKQGMAFRDRKPGLNELLADGFRMLNEDDKYPESYLGWVPEK